MSVHKTTETHEQYGETTQKAEPVLCLYLLFHPDMSRIGEQAQLNELYSLGRTEISRTTPLFFRPDDPQGIASGQSIHDTYISRTPIIIEKSSDEPYLSITCENKHNININGDTNTFQQFSIEELEKGLVIEINRRVVLLLQQSTLGPLCGDSYEMVGSSPGLESVRRCIEKVADLDIPVLIRGESGSGKELVARAIHNHSRRSQHAFVSVNMAAIPESLAPSLLFGASKGAFTGAQQSQKGYFREADSGSLFLDEIGDIPDPLQPTLLRALENGEIQAVGASRPSKADVRLISATDAPLEQKIESGKFRLPLFQRLAGFEIFIPPLRERKADIGLLTYLFLREAFNAVGEAHKFEEKIQSTKDISSLFARFSRHTWPGNVRQLKHFTTQLVILSRGEKSLQIPKHLDKILPQENIIVGKLSPLGRAVQTQSKSINNQKPKNISNEELENTLEKNQWDIKAAADSLNISRASLYNLIDRHPTLRRSRDISNDEFIEAYRRHSGEASAIAREFKLSLHTVKRRLGEINTN